MKKQDDIWQGIQLCKGQDQQSQNEKENIYKRTNILDDWNNQFRRAKQIISKDEEQPPKESVRKVRQEMEKQIEAMKNSHQNEIKRLKEYYEGQLKCRDEDVENYQILLNDESYQAKYELQMNEMKEEFEAEMKKDRLIFKKQLEGYIEEKIRLEKQLQMKEEEMDMLLCQMNEMTEKMNSGRVNVSENCASALFRDTNRKNKLFLHDQTIVEEDMGRQVFYNSIKNFGQNIRLMDKSVNHEI